MSIEARQTAKGVRYDVRLRTPDGRQYKRSFGTRREAETFQARELADRSRGGWVDPTKSSITVAQWASEWLESNPGKRPSSLARDEIILRLHIVPALGKRPLATISPPDVQRLVNTWTKTAAPRTVRRQYDVLRAVMRAAVEADRLVRSPCRGIKLPPRPALDRHIVTAGELAALAQAAGAAYAPMIWLGALVGLRWGECAGLRVGRIDFLNRRLTVAEQATRIAHGRVLFGPPKSDAGRRTITLPAVLVDMLAAHLAARGLSAADHDELVFVAPEGGVIDYGHWRLRVWLPACEAVGLQGLTFHDLRRANATALVAEHVDIKTAQTRLGHADPRTTLGIYARATGEGDRKAADAVARRLLPDITTNTTAAQVTTKVDVP
jgi:integrase